MSVGAKLERGTVAERDDGSARSHRALAATFLEDACSSQRRSQHGSDQPGRMRDARKANAGPAASQPQPRARGRAVQACALYGDSLANLCSATEGRRGSTLPQGVRRGSTMPADLEGRRGSTLPNVQRLPPRAEPSTHTEQVATHTPHTEAATHTEVTTPDEAAAHSESTQATPASPPPRRPPGAPSGGGGDENGRNVIQNKSEFGTDSPALSPGSASVPSVEGGAQAT